MPYANVTTADICIIPTMTSKKLKKYWPGMYPRVVCYISAVFLSLTSCSSTGKQTADTLHTALLNASVAGLKCNTTVHLKLLRYMNSHARGLGFTVLQ